MRAERANPMYAIDWSLVYLTSEWVIRLVMLIYVPQRRPAAASRTWLLFIFLLPWPGLVLYGLFGRIYVSARRIEMQERASGFIRQAQAQIGARVASEPALAPTLRAVPQQAQMLGDFEVFSGNRVELLPSYDQTLDRLVADIEGAQQHVHLLFYIYEPDQVGQRVAAALAHASARGVDCRVLMDAFGSKRALERLAPLMRKNGITVRGMLPVGLFRSNAARFDLRNHRKIAVIDGQVGYTGSQNIVRPEFVPGYPNEELMVRITGPVVAQLQAVFLADYYFETGNVLDPNELFPNIAFAGDTPAQLVPSGPGYGRENGRDLIISLLYAARERVVITTPYFVPDEPFLQAVRAARQPGGVAVHLVLSMHANQLITQLAQRSYYDDLLEAGVEIHLYQPLFLHAKHLTVDDDIALIGSTNIDIRSFALNAEINLLIYDSAIVRELRRIQEGYFAQSEHLDLNTWKRRSLASRVVQNTARLMDSFL
jgi:cardiolipin synthase